MLPPRAMHPPTAVQLTAPPLAMRPPTAFIPPAHLLHGPCRRAVRKFRTIASSRPRVPIARRPRASATAAAPSASTDDQPMQRSQAPATDPATAPRPAFGFVLWGPPGSGKSTVCEKLSHSHGVVHISTGDLLRAHVRYDTDVGSAAKPYVESGAAVPDEVVVPMVLARLAMADCAERGFVLDGFPRNIDQDNALREAGFRVDLAFMLHAPRNVLERRVEARRLDPDTGILYNLDTRRPEEQEILERLMFCDKDVDRNVSQLLAMYGRAAADLFAQISSRLIAVRVDANRDVDAVLADITDALRANGLPPCKDGRKPLTPQDAASAAAASASKFVAPTAKMPPPTVAPRSKQNSTVPDQKRDTCDNEDSQQDKHSSPERKKSPITLIRCDGYMCERESVDGSNIAFRGAATEQVMLVWNKRPTTVLLLAKKDPELMASLVDAAHYLVDVQGLRVIVEPQVQTEVIANGLYLDAFTQPELLHDEVDFVVCSDHFK
jgi:adenylate kinase